LLTIALPSPSQSSSPELLDAFWAGRERVRQTKVAGTKVGPQKATSAPPSATKKNAAAAKPVSSSSSKKETSVVPPSASKRRSSGWIAVEEEEEEDEEEAPVASSSSKKRKAPQAEEEEEEEEAPVEEPEVVEEEEAVAPPSAKKAKVTAAASKKTAEKKGEAAQVISDSDDDEEEKEAAPTSSKKPVAKTINKRASAASLKASPSPAASKGLKNGATPPAKRATPATNGKKSNLSKLAAASKGESDLEEIEVHDMDHTLMSKDEQFADLESWEDVVEKVETIERAEEGEVMIVHLKT